MYSAMTLPRCGRSRYLASCTRLVLVLVVEVLGAYVDCVGGVSQGLSG